MDPTWAPDVDDSRHSSWLTSWTRDGYLVLPGFLSPTDLALWGTAIDRARPLEAGPNALSTDNMEFRSNLFQHSAELQAALCQPQVVELVTTILGPDVWCRWDQAVDKGRGAGWFPWHQDNGYTQLPNVHLQLWIALTASGPENGGLLVAPGRHTELLPHVWEGGHARIDPTDPRIDQTTDGTPIAARPGDAIAFSSLLPHATVPNTSGDDRRAYVAEFLPLNVADTTVPVPHFVVTRNGRPAPRLVDLRPAWADNLDGRMAQDTR